MPECIIASRIITQLGVEAAFMKPLPTSTPFASWHESELNSQSVHFYHSYLNSKTFIYNH